MKYASANHWSINDRLQIINEYGAMVEDKILQGFTGYLLTFMFNNICGTQRSQIYAMMGDVEQFYKALISRVIRWPRTAPISSLAMLIAIPDRPVYKHNKSSFADNAINDGLHAHGIMLIPPVSRLKTGLQTHIDDNKKTYIGSFTRIRRIDVRPINSTPVHATDYVLKHLKRDSGMYDHLLILPKTRSELSAKESRKPMPKRNRMQW